jgi:uncharacterized protein
MSATAIGNAGDVLYRDTIAPGSYWTRVLDRWQRLRIVDGDGRGACSLLAYNAHQPSERLNMPDTVKIQNQIFLSTGRVLFSDMGRVLLSIVDDTSAHHDALCGFGDAALDAARYGPGDYLNLRNDFHRNARDNFVMALGRHGLGRRDLVMSFNPFASVGVAPDGTLEWREQSSTEGNAIELRAEMRVLVALSATPHVLDPAPAYAPGALDVCVTAASDPAVDDACRTFSDEARRGFENTDDYWAQVAR